MNNGISFGGDNNVKGDQMLGDGDIVKDGAVKGDNATVTNTFKGAASDADWFDVLEMVGDDEQGVTHVDQMEAIAAAETEESLSADQADTFKQGLAWMKHHSPGALRVVAAVVKKGPRGGASSLLELMADFIEA